MELRREGIVLMLVGLACALLVAACGEGGVGGDGEPRPEVPFCIPSCETVADCPAGEWACEGGVCVDPTQEENSCENMECGNLTCRNGQCVCESDEQCPGDLFCRSNGACGCTSDADCGSSGIDTCYDGYCGCGSDETCDFFEGFGGGDWVCKTPGSN
jgi:hypothetical protein